MNVLVACEESQRVCIAFREKGHNAYSCDIQPCSGGRPEWHIQGDVLKILNPTQFQTPVGDVYEGIEFKTTDGVWHTVQPKWDMIIAHPPCTYLCSLGTVWFSEKYPIEKRIERKKNQEDAIRFFLSFVNADCEKIAIENPVGIMSTQYKKPTQYIQPYEYGEPFTKKTCLWLKNVPKLEPTNIVEPVGGHWVSAGIKNRESQNRAVNKSGVGESKKARSKTFVGWAKAMAEQWG